MRFLDPALDAYAEAHSGDEPSYLKELTIETREKVESPQMLSGHLQGRFLGLLSQLVRPKVIVEIGTYTGYSALCLAEGLAKGGMVHTIDVNAALTPMVERYVEKAGMGDRITTHIGHGADVVPDLPGPFDLVFIDADKENYPRYWDLVIDRVRAGGLIIADNVLWSGKVTRPEREWDADTRGLVDYARAVKADPRVEEVLVPLRDGLLVARRR
ncbi:MAG: class I SAM-dependent methyltransferase [Flavobacteriales bacterium]|nr:class I SAM-dependent methyltransferase [Flavobacteriales bacterium]MCB9167581.1 class I SAM-dependent methyltransferase [Flavobacteriales bacterium]